MPGVVFIIFVSSFLAVVVVAVSVPGPVPVAAAGGVGLDYLRGVDQFMRAMFCETHIVCLTKHSPHKDMDLRIFGLCVCSCQNCSPLLAGHGPSLAHQRVYLQFSSYYP